MTIAARPYANSQNRGHHEEDRPENTGCLHLRRPARQTHGLSMRPAYCCSRTAACSVSASLSALIHPSINVEPHNYLSPEDHHLPIEKHAGPTQNVTTWTAVHRLERVVLMPAKPCVTLYNETNITHRPAFDDPTTAAKSDTIPASPLAHHASAPHLTCSRSPSGLRDGSVRMPDTCIGSFKSDNTYMTAVRPWQTAVALSP